jgi:hypothetical protein
MHTGGVQDAAAGARDQLRAEQRRQRAGDQNPRREDRVPLGGRAKSIHRRIRQHTVSHLQHDEDRRARGAASCSSKKQSQCRVASNNYFGFFRN